MTTQAGHDAGRREGDAGGRHGGAGGRKGDAGRREGDAGGRERTEPGGRAGRPGAGQRARAGTAWLTQRDIEALVLCGEHYGAPYDLLAVAVGVTENRLRGLVARWRDAGLAAAGRLGPVSWCWLTRDGMAAAGLRYPAARPPLGRLAHIRAVLAARLWLSGAPGWRQWQPWWQSERRIRLGRPRAATGHLADAEIHWPDLDGSPHGGQIWGIEVELTPKTIARTAAIMTEMLTPMRYATVAYLVSPAARALVIKAAATLPPDDRARLAVRDLPETAFSPRARR